MPEQCLHTCRTQLLLWRWLLVDPILSKEFYGSIITLFIWETINSEARFISWECTVPLLSCAVLKISTVSSPFIAQKANLSPNMKNCSHCQFTSTSSPTTKFTDLTVCCHWQAVVIGRRLWLAGSCDWEMVVFLLISAFSVTCDRDRWNRRVSLGWWEIRNRCWVGRRLQRRRIPLVLSSSTIYLVFCRFRSC